MNFLKDTSVLVLGLGESGLAMARWAARCGARVRVWDTREAPPHAATLAAEVPGAALVGGTLDGALIGDATVLLKSPGLAPHDARIAAPLEAAESRGIEVLNELDLFVRALADLHAERDYAPKLIAITGTNGKTTTTAMTALLVARAGKRVAMAGNIGPTMLQTLGEALDAVKSAGADDAVRGDDAAADTPAATAAPAQAPNHALPEVWVLELSSFQLDGVSGFEPSVATVLNITQDHLDWHGSMAAYVEAKGRIFGERTVRVVNADDALVESLATAPPPAPPVPLDKSGKPVRVAKAKPVRTLPPRIVRFGLSAPRHPGDFGLVVDHGMAWLARAQPADETLRSRPRAVKAVADEAVEISIQPLMPADALRVRGRHNAANALAALALAAAIGCALAPMLHGLREYRGEPHRVEFIAQVDGIDAFDDSKGTNVGATVAALDGLGADRAPAKLVVVLGGDGKGQDFSPLVEPLRRHARAIATIGRDAEAIESVIAPVGVPMGRHPTLEAATRWCFEQARPGDAVLLSPACASLDMFRNYAHRADVFVAEVRAIAAERGGAVA